MSERQEGTYQAESQRAVDEIVDGVVKAEFEGIRDDDPAVWERVRGRVGEILAEYTRSKQVRMIAARMSWASCHYLRRSVELGQTCEMRC